MCPDNLVWIENKIDEIGAIAEKREVNGRRMSLDLSYWF